MRKGVREILLILLTAAAPVYAIDDCPPGGVKHAALTGLDHASMEAAVKASFVGLYHREPTGVPGSGPDDIGYWIQLSDHYGAYGDGICRAGWNAYMELRLSGASSGDPSLGDQPARFQPKSTLPPESGLPPVVGNQSVLPSVAVCDLSSITSEIANLRADVDAGRAENQAFYADARSKWEQVATFVGKYGPIVAGAIFAGRASK